MKIYVMIGAPGSGKTTWAKNKNLILVSRDLVREMLGYTKPGVKYRGTQEQEEKVTETQDQIIQDLYNSGKEFAVDDTNVNPVFRKQMIMKLRNLGKDVRLVGVKMETSLDTCISRRKGEVPEEIVTRMWENSKRVKPEEFDQFLVVKGE